MDELDSDPSPVPDGNTIEIWLLANPDNPPAPEVVKDTE
jgi:hypothetical protein